MVIVLMKLVGNDLRALAESLKFVCALRVAMSPITGVPLSDITLTAVSEPPTGLRVIVQVVQQAGSCGARALGQNEQAYRQLQARLVELELEVVLDASRTTLTTIPSNAVVAVQAALRATFADSAAVDTAFADVLRAACIAQGITQSCPNPPSLALRLGAISATPAASSSFDIAALAGGLAAGLLVCLCMLAGGCIYLNKKKAMAPLTASPPSTASSSTSMSDFSYVNPRNFPHHSTVKSIFIP